MKIKLIIIVIGLLAIAAGCPEESEKLLNPPSFSETVNVRLANLTDDEISLEMSLEDVEQVISTAELSKYQVSEALTPPSDSALITVRSGNNILFDTNAYYKFSREFNYAFLALPKANSDMSYDTIIDFTNLGDGNLDVVNAQVKLFNAVPDTNLKVSIAIGCPGGEVFNSFPLSYKEFSFSEPMRADDEVAVSLLGYNDDGTFELGTFTYTFEQGGEYTLLAAYNENNEPKLFVLNENSFEMQELEALFQIQERFTEMRMINLTKNNISLSRNSEEVISNVQPDFLTEYYNISACGSLGSETFTLSSNTMNFNYSPDVNLKYTAIAYTSEFTGLDTLIFIAPPLVDEVREGRALIRSINITHPNTGLTLSYGANSSSDDPNNPNPRGFTSGSSISRGLLYGKISRRLFTYPGLKPVIIFTSNEPSKYISASILDLKADQNYFIFGNKKGENYRFYLISEDQNSGVLLPLDEDILTGLVNAYSNQEELTFSINTGSGNILEDAKIIYEDAVTTVLENGENTVNGESFNVEAGKRMLIIRSGDQNQENIFVSDFPMPQEDQNFKWRFINAAPNTNNISVLLTEGASENYQNIVPGLGYKEVSLTETIFTESNYGLRFVENSSGDTLFTAPNVNVTRGKGYSIIFAGTEGKYSLIVKQEF